MTTYRTLSNELIQVPERDLTPPEPTPETFTKIVNFTLSIKATVQGTQRDIDNTTKLLNGQIPDGSTFRLATFRLDLEEAIEDQIWENVNSEAHDFNVRTEIEDLTVHQE